MIAVHDLLRTYYESADPALLPIIADELEMIGQADLATDIRMARITDYAITSHLEYAAAHGHRIDRVRVSTLAPDETCGSAEESVCSYGIDEIPADTRAARCLQRYVQRIIPPTCPHAPFGLCDSCGTLRAAVLESARLNHDGPLANWCVGVELRVSWRAAGPAAQGRAHVHITPG